MRNLATVISCALLCAYGMFISKESSTLPTNTISAAETNLSSLLNPIKIEVHDTIHTGDTIRDIVPIVKTKIRYKVKREPCAMHGDVSPMHPTLREDRKGTPLDSLKLKLMHIRFPIFLSPKADSIPLLEVMEYPV